MQNRWGDRRLVLTIDLAATESGRTRRAQALRRVLTRRSIARKIGPEPAPCG